MSKLLIDHQNAIISYDNIKYVITFAGIRVPMINIVECPTECHCLHVCVCLCVFHSSRSSKYRITYFARSVSIVYHSIDDDVILVNIAMLIKKSTNICMIDE